jgi:hypothetical protein
MTISACERWKCWSQACCSAEREGRRIGLSGVGELVEDQDMALVAKETGGGVPEVGPALEGRIGWCCGVSPEEGRKELAAPALFRLRSRRRAGRSAAHDELARPGVGAHLDATEEGEFRIAVKKHTLLPMYHACD